MTFSFSLPLKIQKGFIREKNGQWTLKLIAYKIVLSFLISHQQLSRPVAVFISEITKAVETFYCLSLLQPDFSTLICSAQYMSLSEVIISVKIMFMLSKTTRHKYQPMCCYWSFKTHKYLYFWQKPKYSSIWILILRRTISVYTRLHHRHTVPVSSLDTPSHSLVFPDF